MSHVLDGEMAGHPLDPMRHSAAHTMAEAVKHFFPDAKLGIGPTIADGFYYDFDLPRSLTPEDIEQIESRMREYIAADQPLVRGSLSKDEAREFFKDQPYKLELIDGIPDEEIGIYSQNGFTDLCRGPHVASTGQIKAFKLLNTAGAYWRGDEKRPMLQRIYGTAFETEQELQEYLRRLEEAAKRDHRKLGRELGLFTVSDDVGPGLILWLPKGGRLRTLIEDHWRQRHFAGGYDIVYSPHIGRSRLWETSGHLGFYQENMYSEMDVEGQDYYVKPMNCPFHIQMYKNTLRSYRDLPLRFAELGTVYRYERSGVLHGLLRVRGFTQDDAHIFCRPDQVPHEIGRALDFTLSLLRDFGFTEFETYLATQPARAIGTEEQWALATEWLREQVQLRGLPFHVDEGGGAFYGPKIDLKLKDVLGREWQCSTIQFDFNEPERFGLEYIGEDGQPHQPYMIHRALLGSLERFLGVLIEHYAGAFPVWLAPVQAVVIPIADRHVDYARTVELQLAAAGLRAQVDDSAERMNSKIRQAQLQKIPYMLVVGDKEAEAGAVAVRLRDGQNLGALPVADFLQQAEEAIAKRV